jgi:hypothetical protein
MFILWFCFAFFCFAISVLILRWAFRINTIVERLDKITERLDDIVNNGIEVEIASGESDKKAKLE